MKYHLFLALIFSFLLQQSQADDEIYISPNKKLEIVSKLLPVVPVFNEAFLTASLKVKDNICWTYGSIAREFSFSWAPDSSGFLFGVTHITRSMYLYYVTIDSEGDAYPISIDLDAIKRHIAASLPKKIGNSAPKSSADIDHVQWISPKKCRVKFYQRCLGENADSILELNLVDPYHPAIKVVSTEPK